MSAPAPEPSGPPANEFLLRAGEYRVWADHVRLDPDGVGTMEVTAGAVPEQVVPRAGAAPELVERQLRAFDEKLRRYLAVIEDPGNPIRRLTIPAPSAEAGAVLLARARAIAGPAADLRVCVRAERESYVQGVEPRLR
ncbi:hypothetical protein [Cellulomonas denverensis]|uniref:Uncharacterized protein n=1 Tax=Cellulomonas denverensis TaxID=264297 RepID=A0A7X6KW59_9CELL|nr:hypothetical protein [Cellulomonas denverensis]NKY23346.1 hypothetical protein [Cellulomonas denverensis]GIG24365.1 hypothetical protein Cde04nite_06090 [Cellulomonas denverensis]